jgi:hypothetical protein
MAATKSVPQGLKARCICWVYVWAKAHTYQPIPTSPYVPARTYQPGTLLPVILETKAGLDASKET